VEAVAAGTFYGQAMTAGNIYTVAGSGKLGAFAGDGGPATRAKLNGPAGVTVDSAGNLVVSDSGNQRVRVVAVATGSFYGQAMTAGDIYTVAGDGTKGFGGDGGPATGAEFSSPQGVAVDAAGNLLIADSANNRARVIAVATGSFYGQAMTAGDIYTVAGTGVAGFSADGHPAVRSKLDLPTGVAVDGVGNLLVADALNQRIRVVSAGTGTFYGQAMIAGDIYTVAGTGTAGFSGDGGLAIQARLNHPGAVSVDAAGNVVIADTLNGRARVLAAATGSFYGLPMQAGRIYGVVGLQGRCGFSGERVSGRSARLCKPAGVAVDGTNLVIADTGANRVRMVSG
jgi:hypothetical protein